MFQLNWDPDIKGVILFSAFGNLPWKSRNIPVKMRAIAGPGMPITGQEVPITGQHFLTYRWEQTSVADGTYWIHRIPLPILLVRDQADGLVQPFESHQLLSAAHSEGSLVTNVRYVLLPDAKPPDRDGHLFIGNEQPLTETVLSWLAEQHL